MTTTHYLLEMEMTESKVGKPLGQDCLTLASISPFFFCRFVRSVEGKGIIVNVIVMARYTC